MKVIREFTAKEKALASEVRESLERAIKSVSEAEIDSFILVYRRKDILWIKGHSGRSTSEAVGMLESAKMDLLTQETE